MAGSDFSLEAQAGPTRVLPDDIVQSLPSEPELADFELLRELGEGAQGRVFLAREKSLDDRPVVLKVTACRGREHISLARLQHTHIVPLYWAHDEVEANRRTLCMPFFGTLTLEGLLRSLDAKGPSLRTGKDILDILDQARDSSPIPFPSSGPARNFLEQASFAQVVFWIGRCLAEALHYAHERGLVHLDLKPSNVLIAGDGQPMLLDFHLAREPISAGSVPRGIGGTPMYMAPEQREALHRTMDGTPCDKPVDGRADLFSLGLMLYQTLGGPLHQRDPYPRLEHVNSQVTTGMSDIIQRCLTPNPEDRYPTAAALADDLRRHLADQPLLGVANRDWKERWHKWRRRRPHALFNYAILFLALSAIIGVLLYADQMRRSRQREQVDQMEVNWMRGRKEAQDHRFDAAVSSLKLALSFAEKSQRDDWQIRIQDDLQAAQRGQRLAKLHELADQVRFASASLNHSADDIEPACRQLWEARDKLLKLVDDHPGIERDQMRMDLLDIVLILARTRPASDELAGPRYREIFTVLQEAETLFGLNAVLLHEKMRLAEEMKDRTLHRQAANLLASNPPRSAWDHFSLGRLLLQQGQLVAASQHFDRAIELEPDGFWPHFYQGVCAYRQKEYDAAVSAFRAALVSQPKCAEVYFNRALAYAELGADEKARADINRAQHLNPDLIRRILERRPDAGTSSELLRLLETR